MRRWLAGLVMALLVLGAAGPAAAKRCQNGRSADAAMWLSIAHAGIGEWMLNGWGSFPRNAPQKKFWLGWLPGYGYPYLSIVSATDAFNCRTDDDLKL